jgi:hypothetical protein
VTANEYEIFLFLFFSDTWGLNSRPHTCCPCTLPLGPLHQPLKFLGGVIKKDLELGCSDGSHNLATILKLLDRTLN